MRTEQTEATKSLNEKRKEWLFGQMDGHWRTVDYLSKYCTEPFPDFIVNGVPVLNQGWLDPKFCVSRRSPGDFIKSGELIFRPCRTGSRSRYEFKLRSSAQDDEISECEMFAADSGLFIFGLTGEKGGRQ